jgi:hypothetical protein
MIEPWLVVAVVTVIIGISGGIKISIGDINIGNKTKEKSDN